MYWRKSDLTLTSLNQVDTPPSPSRLLSAPQSRFGCQCKTRCPQMRSCAEARFYQNNCPNTQMDGDGDRSEEHPSELQSLMRISYAVTYLTTNKLYTYKHHQQT